MTTADPRRARLSALLAQLAPSRAERVELLRDALAELEETSRVERAAEHDEIERVAAELRAGGYSVLPGGWIHSSAAAAMLGVSEPALRVRRSRGTGPAWQAGRDGRVAYRIRGLLEWRGDVTERYTEAEDRAAE